MNKNKETAKEGTREECVINSTSKGIRNMCFSEESKEMVNSVW